MNRFPLHTFQQDAILARLSQALVALEVSNVKSLTSEQCDKLQCGDVVVKKDSSGQHSYVVTFKSDTGMCLTYMDASVIETQSYDKGESGWVYNSEDKTPNLLELQNVEDAPSGSIADSLGLDSEGKLVKGAISGGTKLYKHEITLSNYPSIDFINISLIDGTITITSETPSYASKKVSFINNNSNQLTSLDTDGYSYIAYFGSSSYILIQPQMGVVRRVLQGTPVISIMYINYGTQTFSDSVTAL